MTDEIDIAAIRHRLATHYDKTDVEQEAIDVAALCDAYETVKRERDQERADAQHALTELGPLVDLRSRLRR
jgi:hypothetical protein